MCGLCIAAARLVYVGNCAPQGQEQQADAMSPLTARQCLLFSDVAAPVPQS